MNSYQASTPRAAISIAAAAMTALTLGLSILPAELNSGGNGGSLVDAPRTFGPAAVAIPGEGMPIVVYGVREQETAMQKLARHAARRAAAKAAKLSAASFPVARIPRRATGSVKGRARCVRPFAFAGRVSTAGRRRSPRVRARAAASLQPDSPGRFLRQSTSGAPAARFKARASTNSRSDRRLT